MTPGPSSSDLPQKMAVLAAASASTRAAVFRSSLRFPRRGGAGVRRSEEAMRDLLLSRVRSLLGLEKCERNSPEWWVRQGNLGAYLCMAVEIEVANCEELNLWTEHGVLPE